MLDVHELPPWRASGLLTHTRTAGKIGFNKNGGLVDIWIRVNGKPKWFGVNQNALRVFLSDAGESELVLPADSDGNSEQ